MELKLSPSFLFNSAIATGVACFILLLNGSLIFGIISLIAAITFSVIWFFSGLFDKFDSSPVDIEIENEGEENPDNDGKGVLKPF